MMKINYLKLLFTGILSSFYQRYPNLWLMGEWFGSKCCDNTLYFANYIAEFHPDVKIVWVSKLDVDISALNKRINVVGHNSAEAIEYLKHSGVIVCQQSCIGDFVADSSLWGKNAINVNLWHGVPWKHIGQDSITAYKDVSILNKQFHRYVAKFIDEDIFISLSSKFSEILRKAYSPKKIIEAGYPRNSLFYSSESINVCRKKILSIITDQFKIELPPNIKVITYMPTFRDRDEYTFSFEKLVNNERFYEILKKYNCLIIQKAHFVSNERGVYRSTIDNSRIINLNDVASQELLAATDILITDYSSCFFDFLLLNRPIIHYLYDYDYYTKQDRGLYYPKEEVVCGDVAVNEYELISVIEANLLNPDKDKDLRKKRKEEYLTFESPKSCEIIYQEIVKELKNKYGDINL